jgi:adenosine deaminase
MEARALARLAARYAGEGVGEVVGFGLSNDEKRGVTSEFSRAFDIARRAGLASMPHGGELLGPEHVEDVVEHLHANRIGHGVRASEDHDSLSRIVDKGVAFELCPLSNVMLGVYQRPKDVPLPRLLRAGARVTLNADDPVIFGSRLLDQYEMARNVHGLSDEQLAGIAATSIEASRATQATKSRLLADVGNWLKTPA